MQKKNTIKKSALAPTILIAGGAGFIGSHLAEMLLQKEARVIVLDNFSKGKDFYVNHLIKNPKFALYDVNINESIPPEIESVDYIFHLAGLEEYLYSKDEVDLDSLLTNAVGTKNLLDLAKRSDAKFLLASTLDVYSGHMSQLDLDTYYGKSPYVAKRYSMAEAKRYAEALVWEYYKRTSIDARIVRLPEVYGPRMSLISSGYLGKFVTDLMNKNNLEVRGDGTEKEYYLYVDDAVSGMIKALLNENTEGKIYTLVPEEPSTVLETAFLVRGLADRRLDVNFIGEDTFHYAKSFKPDTQNLSDLKWQPKISLKDGLIHTMVWFGYDINQHSFKNAKLIEKKKEEKQPVSSESQTPSEVLSGGEQLMSLQGVKEDPKSEAQDQSNVSKEPTEEPAVSQQIRESYNSRKIDDAKDIPKIKSKKKLKFKLELPKTRLNLNLPQISLASKLSLFFVVLFSFLAVFIFLPAIQTYSSTKNAIKELESTPDYIAQFKIEEASLSAREAQKSFTRAKKYYSSLSWIYKVLGKEENHQSVLKLLSSLSYYSTVAYDISNSTQPFQQIWESLKPNSETIFDATAMDDSKLYISNAKNNLQYALADFSEIDEEKVPSFMGESLPIYEEVLNSTAEGLDLAWAVTANLTDLLGFNGSKKYLILFQNNNELRPTGGFIGSYAFLYLKEGKIEELTIDDIYNPDGQIDVRNIRVTPPKPIGDFLVEDRLYIRNANWDPDFTRSASTIRDLFYRLNGENIDGVIAVDLHLVRKLLDVTGPIFLTSYNEEVTSQNLYERTQYHASYNYEEGSQQKRQFLTVLGSKLLESLFALNQDRLPDFLNSVNGGLDERHLQIYFFSSPLSASLQEREWAGSLIKTEGDYLQVVNANLGGTKANYYMKNSMEYNVTSKTRDGVLRGELILDYTHTGVDESWPGGPYTNYVRVLTQKGAKLTGAKIVHDMTMEEDIFEQIAISGIEPYTSFETSFTLDPNSNLKLVLYYDLPANLSITKENTDYSLIWQKQAGTHNDDFTYTFAPPFGMQPAVVNENAKFEDGIISTSGKINDDLKLNFKLE